MDAETKLRELARETQNSWAFMTLLSALLLVTETDDKSLPVRWRFQQFKTTLPPTSKAHSNLTPQEFQEGILEEFLGACPSLENVSPDLVQWLFDQFEINEKETVYKFLAGSPEHIKAVAAWALKSCEVGSGQPKGPNLLSP
jgi:hypothetical protein